MVVVASGDRYFIWCCGNFALDQINTGIKQAGLCRLSLFRIRAEHFFGEMEWDSDPERLHIEWCFEK